MTGNDREGDLYCEGGAQFRCLSQAKNFEASSPFVSVALTCSKASTNCFILTFYWQYV